MKTNMLVLILSLMFLTSCYAARIDGPYEGKVIDADTGQPIEEVVVLGTWSTVTITPGGGTHDFYDAQETVTNRNGEFKIEGLGMKMMSNVAPMNILVFKAGYKYVSGSWSSLKEFAEEIKWEGKKAVIPLKKLTLEDRKRRMSIPYPAPEDKMKLMLDEIHKERRELGLRN